MKRGCFCVLGWIASVLFVGGLLYVHYWHLQWRLPVVLLFSAISLGFLLYYVYNAFNNHTKSSLDQYAGRLKLQNKRLLSERIEKVDLLDHLQEGVILIDNALEVVYINAKGNAILAIDNECIGESVFALKSEKNAFLLKHIQSLLHSAKEQHLPLMYTQEKTRKVYELRLCHLEGGRFLVLIDDRSEHHYEDIGRDFIANASHELRTPITIIKGFTETLCDLSQISEAMLEDILEKILRNCERMDNLVKNLLTLADVDHIPKERFQTCDLVALIDNCNQTLLVSHPTVCIESLHSHDIISVLADPDFLELAIMNLLENAVKYSSPQETVCITVILEQEEEGVFLRIQDQGQGIPKQAINHIFRRFYTVDKSHSRQLGGAGLGLSIVQRIIECHKGKITVDSSVGKGSTFTLQFPLP